MNETPEKPPEYQVLARKYRPSSFADLLGHEAMQRTLRNAFATNRIAHAFMLTGVRGVGKTTTARILARALNYQTDTIDAPTIDMASEGQHCRAIAQGRHQDVIEMDAASRTGVGDIRELIEAVRYAPVEARYKVYIIDEVHMLSTSAFNALLKTLEEPPPHVKFIFATTEIRKVPVTVLSRCQRFDLKRFDQETLAEFLAGIATKEEAQIDQDGLMLIARAAEGSVRDALSLLDQAIIQYASEGSKDPVTAAQVQDMLGLADRAASWTLLTAAMTGDAPTALKTFRTQYDAGADPVVILRDLLEILHLLTRVKAAGEDAASHGPAGDAEAKQAQQMASDFSMAALTRAWGLMMTGLKETQTAPDAAAAAEMGLIRLAYASDLPTPDEALRLLTKQTGATTPQPAAKTTAPPATPPATPMAIASGGTQMAQPTPVSTPTSAPAPQTQLHPPALPGPKLESFADIIALAKDKRDIQLVNDLERYVQLVSFAPGRIEFNPSAAAPRDLSGRLAKRLQDWTKQRWVVSITSKKQGDQTMRSERDAKIRANPLVKAALETFPGATFSVRDIKGEALDEAPSEIDEDETED
ncbi:MAG: DNA polymerase III subunit gamma/tau [Parvularculaceae bacterium]